MGTPAKVLAPGDVRRLQARAAHGRYALRNKVMVLLSFKAGLRACEMAGLDWSMVIATDGKIGSSMLVADGIAKNGRGRHLPIHPDLKSALMRLHSASERPRHGPMIEWSENVQPPTTAEEFAGEAIYVICNSGMNNRVAGPIAVRCLAVLAVGASATTVFGHPGKAAAIDTIWQQRAVLFERYCRENDKVDMLIELPWIGPVTRHHLAKNLGAETAKPDVHLERLARRDKTTTQMLCRRLARQTGYRAATIDSILWRACADGLLNSRRYEAEGWRAAFRPKTLETSKVDLSD